MVLKNDCPKEKLLPVKNLLLQHFTKYPEMLAI